MLKDLYIFKLSLIVGFMACSANAVLAALNIEERHQLASVPHGEA